MMLFHLYVIRFFPPDIFVAGEHGRIVSTRTQFYGHQPRGSSSVSSSTQKSAKRSQGTSLPLIGTEEKSVVLLFKTGPSINCVITFCFFFFNVSIKITI